MSLFHKMVLGIFLPQLGLSPCLYLPFPSWLVLYMVFFRSYVVHVAYRNADTLWRWKKSKVVRGMECLIGDHVSLALRAKLFYWPGPALLPCATTLRRF